MLGLMQLKQQSNQTSFLWVGCSVIALVILIDIQSAGKGKGGGGVVACLGYV